MGYISLAGLRSVEIAKPANDPPLGGMPATLVESVGGTLGDIAHDAKALERAQALATGEHSTTFSPLLMRYSSCFRWQWRAVWAMIIDGKLHVFANSTASSPLRTLMVSDCECEVGEREECKTDYYCFRLQHSYGQATFCALNSKSLLLWLQALQSGGVKYEDPVIDLGDVKSLFDMNATLLSGEEIEMERYRGCVCLVVNGASK